MDDFERELKAGFLDEVAQSLADAEQCFLNLESAKEDPSIIEKIFRLAHNIKGSARAVGFNDMGEFTHQLESLLLKIKNHEIAVQSSTVTLLLKCNDFLRLWVDALKLDMNAKIDAHHLHDEIQDQLSGRVVAVLAPPPALAPVPPLETTPTLESAAIPSPDDSAWNDIQPSPATLAATAPFEAPIYDLKPAAAKIAAAKPVAVAASTDESIRVSLRRLETLVNNVGELVILQTVLNQHRHQVQSPLLQKTIGQLAKITKDLQDISLSLRMVPLKQTFQKMQRIVRDTSQALGKEVHLELAGEDTELDKTMVEALGDPLVHLVRNAVDHGVEPAEERVAAGKPAGGNVKLAAYHRGGQLILEITDDGRGLDAQKLRDSAIKKGVLRPDQVISDSEAHHLVFAPGFSTKAEVTEISGRGVGMDVVKTNIETVLQGKVELETELGKGTCFRVVLPLTLAIIDGLVVKAGEERYVIPLTQVHETLQHGRQEMHQTTGLGEVLHLREENLPVYHLSHIFGGRARTGEPAETIALVCRTGRMPFALIVDDIVGQQQVVIKQLGGEIGSMPGLSGGAILGDGRPALILDVNELVNRISVRRPGAGLRGVA